MELLSYLTSFNMGLLTLVVIYIFNWFKFRSNLNFFISKFFDCIFCCCRKKNNIEYQYQNIVEEGETKDYSKIIVEKLGLILRRHPYGKSGIQGLNQLKFVRVNKQRYPDLSNLYYYNNNLNWYQMQMILNGMGKEEEKIVNQVYEFEGNNKFKNISNQFTEIDNEGIDKSILFNFKF